MWLRLNLQRLEAFTAMAQGGEDFMLPWRPTSRLEDWSAESTDDYDDDIVQYSIYYCIDDLYTASPIGTASASHF